MYVQKWVIHAQVLTTRKTSTPSCPILVLILPLRQLEVAVSYFARMSFAASGVQPRLPCVPTTYWHSISTKQYRLQLGQ